MKSLSILVVEDDALLAMVLEELLVGMGHEVCATANTEIAAIDAAGKYKPDLMIVDAGLLQGSGTGAVDQVSRSGRVPHVFVSGNTGRIKATRPDALVLQKPFRLADLAATIEIACSSECESAN